MLPALLLLRPVAALGGAGTDKIALHVCEAAEHGNLNISVAGGTSGSNPLSSSCESCANSTSSKAHQAPAAAVAPVLTSAMVEVRRIASPTLAESPFSGTNPGL